MSVISNIASWDRKFAWSFFGFILAVFFGGLTLYNEFIKNPNPDLSIETLADTNVLDVREEVPELKIIYGDVDIKSIGQTLSVVVFRIRNNGGASILNSFYDEKATPKIQLSTGKFIKVEQLNATNAYLIESAKPLLSDQLTLHLPRVILEPGEAYTIKTLILRGPRSTSPFAVTGKIAGIRDLKITPLQVENQQKSFWAETYSGAITTQLVRAPSYFFGFIALLFVVISPIVFAVGRVQTFSRSRIEKQFRSHYRSEIDQPKELLLKTYSSYGLGPLVRIRELLGKEDDLKRVLDIMSKPSESTKRFPGIHGIDTRSLSESHASHPEIIFSSGGIPFTLLKELNIASLAEDGTCQIDSALESFLARFIDFVNIKES